MPITDLLTEGRIRGAKPKSRPYKLRDGGGLFYLITPANASLWRLRYKVRGRENMLGLGTYPATSLKTARAKRGELRAALEAGKNPAAERRAERDSRSNTFESWPGSGSRGNPFPEDNDARRSGRSRTCCSRTSEHDRCGLTAPELLGVFRRLERRDKRETAHRARQRVSQVVRYAIATGRAARDPTADLRGALAPVRVKNRPAIIEPREVAQLLRAQSMDTVVTRGRGSL